jgi:hypothetical protein
MPNLLPPQSQYAVGRQPVAETEDDTRGYQLAAALDADRRHRSRLVAQIEWSWRLYQVVEGAAILLASPLALYFFPAAFLPGLVAVVALQFVASAYQSYLRRLAKRTGLPLPVEGPSLINWMR